MSLKAVYNEKDKIIELYLKDDLIHIETVRDTADWWFQEEVGNEGIYDFNFNEHPEKSSYSLIKYNMFLDDNELLQTDPGNYEPISLKVQ